MVKLIHRDQAVIKYLHTEPVDGKTESCVGTYQNLFITFKKSFDCVDFPAIVSARGIAKIAVRFYFPVCKKTELAQWLIVEARANRLFRHHNYGLFEPLIMELVQGNKHESPTVPPVFARHVPASVACQGHWIWSNCRPVHI